MGYVVGQILVGALVLTGIALVYLVVLMGKGDRRGAMSDFGRERAWQETEREGAEMARSIARHRSSPYREECTWWARYLAYCESLPASTVQMWMDVVMGWTEAVGYTDATKEVLRLRREMKV